MNNNDELVRVFTGTEIDVSYIKAELEARGISALIKNLFQSGLTAGFVGGTPSSIDLFVAKSNAEKAMEIINRMDKS